MSIIDQHKIRNRILGSLAHGDFSRLKPLLEARAVPARSSIFESGEAISHAYFPESGMVSLVTPGDDATEVGVIGKDGVVGAQLVLGVDSSPLRAFGQIPGDGHVISGADLKTVLAESPPLRDSLGRYVQIITLQASETAYANGNYTVEQRLARWLLMCQDRVGDELVLTHEFMAMMLGCRRPGVTVATHVLEGHGFIRAKRGRITIRNREGLIDFADRSYGMAEAEYERLFGPLPDTPSEEAITR